MGGFLDRYSKCSESLSVCLAPFYIVRFYNKLVKTFWTHSIMLTGRRHQAQQGAQEQAYGAPQSGYLPAPACQTLQVLTVDVNIGAGSAF